VGVGVGVGVRQLFVDDNIERHRAHIVDVRRLEPCAGAGAGPPSGSEQAPCGLLPSSAEVVAGSTAARFVVTAAAPPLPALPASTLATRVCCTVFSQPLPQGEVPRYVQRHLLPCIPANSTPWALPLLSGLQRAGCRLRSAHL
jgi:hypothetical protein